MKKKLPKNERKNEDTKNYVYEGITDQVRNNREETVCRNGLICSSTLCTYINIDVTQTKLRGTNKNRQSQSLIRGTIEIEKYREDARLLVVETLHNSPKKNM